MLNSLPYVIHNCSAINFISKTMSSISRNVENSINEIIPEGGVVFDLTNKTLEQNIQSIFLQEKQLLLMESLIHNLEEKLYVGLDTKFLSYILSFLLNLQDKNHDTKKTTEIIHTTNIERSISNSVLKVLSNAVVRGISSMENDTELISSSQIVDIDNVKNPIGIKNKFVCINSVLKHRKTLGKLLILLPNKFAVHFAQKNALEKHSHIFSSQGWQEQFQQAMNNVEVMLEAKISGHQSKSLDEIKQWKIGDTLMLNQTKDSIKVKVYTKSNLIAKGKACKKEGETGVLIEQIY